MEHITLKSGFVLNIFLYACKYASYRSMEYSDSTLWSCLDFVLCQNYVLQEASVIENIDFFISVDG